MKDKQFNLEALNFPLSMVRYLQKPLGILTYTLIISACSIVASAQPAPESVEGATTPAAGVSPDQAQPASEDIASPQDTPAAGEVQGEDDKDEVEKIAEEDQDLTRPTLEAPKPPQAKQEAEQDKVTPHVPKRRVVQTRLRKKQMATPMSGKKRKRRFPQNRPSRDLLQPPVLGKIPFAPGEQLTFKVNMLGAHAGTVTLRVGKRGTLKGRQVLELSGFIQSSPFLENFYPIRDSLRVLVDERSFLPVRSEFYLDERQKKIEYISDFNLETGEVTWEKKREIQGKERTTRLVYDGPQSLHQTLSSLYALRRLPLKKDLKFEQYIWDGQRERLITVLVAGEEQVLTGIGRVDAYRLEISGVLTGGIISRDSLKRPPVKATAWIAKDAARTPIKAITPTKLGNAEALLSARAVLP